MAKTKTNPRRYVNRIDVPAGRIGDFEVVHEILPAGKPISDGTARTQLFGQPLNTFRFAKDTRWHRLRSDSDGTWMTDLPVEQRQMESAAGALRGRVLVGGLGLGVIPTMVPTRVTEIVVVERAPEVIRLVEEAARLRCKTKLTVVEADLFEYLKHLPQDFDTAFFDIWQGDGEATLFSTVLPLLDLAKQSNKIKRRPFCWNEDVMRGQLLVSLSSRLHLYKLPAGSPFEEVCGSLEVLSGPPTGDRWIDWQRPFWRWVKAYQHLSAEQQELKAAEYALTYGDPWHEKSD